MRFVLRGQEIDLTCKDVYSVARQLAPEPIRKHFVRANGKTFPPKQLLGEVFRKKDIGLGRLDFTTMDAHSILRRLGLGCGEESKQIHTISMQTLSGLVGIISIGGDALKDSERCYE